MVLNEYGTKWIIKLFLGKTETITKFCILKIQQYTLNKHTQSIHM